MFAPPMILSMAAARSIGAFRSNAMVHGALRGVTPAMAGILLAAAIALWKTFVHSFWPASVAMLAILVVLIARRILPFFILVGGGVTMLVFANLR
jgi:chromate transport protein ChrA